MDTATIIFSSEAANYSVEGFPVAVAIAFLVHEDISSEEGPGPGPLYGENYIYKSKFAMIVKKITVKRITAKQ